MWLYICWVHRLSPIEVSDGKRSSPCFRWRKWSSVRLNAFLPGHTASNWRTGLKICGHTPHRASELLQVLQVQASCKLPALVHSGGLVFQGYPGFVLIRYDKTYRHGNGCHEGRILLYSQIPKKRRHGTPCRAMWGSTMRGQERVGRSFIVVSLGRNGWDNISRFRIS